MRLLVVSLLYADGVLWYYLKVFFFQIVPLGRTAIHTIIISQNVCLVAGIAEATNCVIASPDTVSAAKRGILETGVTAKYQLASHVLY